MTRQGLAVVLLLTTALASACASKPASGASSQGTGTKILKGVVVDREREAPGTADASFQGTGNYYLIFEVQDGDASARYRYQVTYQQWFRFPEGSRVQITLRNNFLQDIRAGE